MYNFNHLEFEIASKQTEKPVQKRNEKNKKKSLKFTES